MSALRIEAAGGTHVGLARANNEDSYAVLPEIGLFAVTDGIGGKPGGEVASRLAIEVVQGCLAEDDPEETWPMGRLGLVDRDEARLVGSLRRANRQIYDTGRRDPGLRGMGTTFAGILITGERLYIAHVGDSRIYRVRGGRLARLTRDHTVIEDFLREAGCDADAVRDIEPDLASCITRAVGTDAAVEVETRIEDAKPGDVLLVCTDGLWGPVPEDALASVLRWNGRTGAIVAGLIAAALEHGGPDNVTCVVVRFRGH